MRAASGPKSRAIDGPENERALQVRPGARVDGREGARDLGVHLAGEREAVEAELGAEVPRQVSVRLGAVALHEAVRGLRDGVVDEGRGDEPAEAARAQALCDTREHGGRRDGVEAAAAASAVHADVGAPEGLEIGRVVEVRSHAAIVS
jgi:hypothetical protein